MSYESFLDLETIQRIHDWLREHDKNCPYSDPMKCGAIGGRLTYCFTPTALGLVIKVKCGCGEEKDVSDYDSW